MSQSVEKLIYRGNIASIAPGQVATVAAATHGLVRADGVALVPNLCACAPLEASINATTGDVILVNNTSSTLTNVRVTLAYDHTYVGAQDNPFGTIVLDTITAAAPTTNAQAALSRGLAFASIERQNPATAVATGAVPLNTLTVRGFAASLGSNLITVPLGIYKIDWNVSITSGAAGIFEVQAVDGGGTILGSSSVEVEGSITPELVVSGSTIAEYQVGDLATQGQLGLNMVLTNGAGSTYGHSGAAENEIVGGITLQKIG